MPSRRVRTVIFVSLAIAPAALGQQYQRYVAVVDAAAAPRIMLFDAGTGALVNASWVTYAGAGIAVTDGATPKGIAQVGNQVWVTDQAQDCIYRFKADLASPVLLGRVAHPADGGGLDNVRGLAYSGGTVYVANAGAANGAPGNALVRFTLTGVNLGSFPVGNPFDVLPFNGELLVTNTDDDTIDRYSTAGALLGVFHNSNGVSGVDFPQQLALRAGGTVLCAGFSAPVGVYEYAANGTQLHAWGVGTGDRGVVELDNGSILFTHGQRVDVLDPVSGAAVPVLTSAAMNAHYAAIVTFTCPADVDLNGFVNGDDSDAFAFYFSIGDPRADWDGNTFVNGDDFDGFAAAFYAGC